MMCMKNHNVKGSGQIITQSLHIYENKHLIPAVVYDMFMLTMVTIRPCLHISGFVWIPRHFVAVRPCIHTNWNENAHCNCKLLEMVSRVETWKCNEFWYIGHLLLLTFESNEVKCGNHPPLHSVAINGGCLNLFTVTMIALFYCCPTQIQSTGVF